MNAGGEKPKRVQRKRVRDEANALTARVEALWQPIETADREALLLLWTPPERLYTDPTSGGPDIRVSTPHNWTWATHWMPLPAPPDVAAAPREGTLCDYLQANSGRIGSYRREIQGLRTQIAHLQWMLRHCTCGAVPPADLDAASIRTGCETAANREADRKLRELGYVFDATEQRWLRPAAPAPREGTEGQP